MNKYFCEHLVLNKEALRMAYICNKTNEICPRVRYGTEGEANPDILYKLRGCEYKTEGKTEKAVESKNIEIKEVEKENTILEEVKEENIQPVEEKNEKENSTLVKKQNNYKKKNKQYNKQNQVKNK